jgi:hypothetical protein
MRDRAGVLSADDTPDASARTAHTLAPAHTQLSARLDARWLEGAVAELANAAMARADARPAARPLAEIHPEIMARPANRPLAAALGMYRPPPLVSGLPAVRVGPQVDGTPRTSAPRVAMAPGAPPRGFPPSAAPEPLTSSVTPTLRPPAMLETKRAEATPHQALYVRPGTTPIADTVAAAPTTAAALAPAAQPRASPPAAPRPRESEAFAAPRPRRGAADDDGGERHGGRYWYEHRLLDRCPLRRRPRLRIQLDLLPVPRAPSATGPRAQE